MRRPFLCLASALVIAAGALPLVSGVSGAQTSTLPTVTTTPVTTAVTTPTSTASTVTTVPGGATTTTTSTTTTTTRPRVTTTVPATDDDSGGSLPWIPIAAALALLGIIVVAVMATRKRAAKRRLRAEWRHRAADATAEAGAVTRVLSQGAAPSGQIAQQILTSLRTFEDLVRSAPDEATAATADRARRALQTLGLAIDANYRLRRAQPVPEPQQLESSAESLRSTAGEMDRTLRGVYRNVTESD